MHVRSPESEELVGSKTSELNEGNTQRINRLDFIANLQALLPSVVKFTNAT